ncbi:hypothetical protein EDD18DRAFT_215497 [Armillaria luteobubalina]|uniref:Uncharacterized protein n=1 Tax=Armillaria luteobubalina TaxID=153913 RepID=A0AA39P0J6_9AGAR|nr:hypothetical protein EDD18DRAFT_215497 [Armillaria luteobubalina]
MPFFNQKQIADGNATSVSSPALSSSSTPAQASGSASNNAASVKSKGKGTFSQLWRRDKRSRTNTTGDIATMLLNSESPTLQSNSSTVGLASQPLDNAQTMTTKGKPDNPIVTNCSYGNKTANAAMILGIVQAICEVLNKVPYVKVVTGLVSTAIKVIELMNVRKNGTRSKLLSLRSAILCLSSVLGRMIQCHYPMMSSLHFKSL